MTETTTSPRNSSENNSKPSQPKDIADLVARHVRQRYRAEARFKTYGAAAILAAAAFLLTLFWSILSTGIPAFTQHSIVAEVDVSAELIDPSGKRNPAELRNGDYFGLARNFIRAEFPEIRARRDRIKLSQLLSDGAADELRAEVQSDPSIIGKKIKTKLLLSDDADIYFKGESTRIVETKARGIATPTATEGDVILSTSSNDFAEILIGIKKALANKSAGLRRQADRIAGRSGSTPPARVQQLRDEAKALQARVDAPRIAEALSFDIPSVLVSINGGIIKVNKLNSGQVEGTVIKPLKSVEPAKGGDWSILKLTTPEANRKLSDKEVVWLEALKGKGLVSSHFNWRFFSTGDSREAEQAGIRGAIMGSFLTLLVTLILCLPIGVLAAIYLEEFAPRNWITDVIEININNLAAVPSIVFGLLGLAVFLNFFGMPRSAPLVGGFVLALMTLPTIIIASRAAIRAVPPSIREGALGVGASHQQAVFHHVLPLAMPGIMTGTIVGMAQALGETAPLLMIGMVAFIVDVPGGFTDPATVLPVQIFLWSDLPEIAFQAKTSAAIIVLLLFLFLMNGTAIVLRKRFERRW